ncbi:DNA-binding protein HRm [Rickettsiales bacterium Ac37b]|nr:DNA-binding protein HRm [Rickettsiales bacterium Ac37b]
MNKKEFVSAIADRVGMTKSDAERALDAFVDIITETLEKGGKEGVVRLVGFGTWSVNSRKASHGRNPRTGASLNIPASKLPKFKAGKGLKDAVNHRKSSGSSNKSKSAKKHKK